MDFFLNPNERKGYDSFVKKGSTNATRPKESINIPLPFMPIPGPGGQFYPSYQPRFPIQGQPPQAPPFRDPRFDSFQRQ